MCGVFVALSALGINCASQLTSSDDSIRSAQLPIGRVGTVHDERVNGRTPKDVIEELFRRGLAGDDGVIDELVAEDLVNHAAGGEDDLRGPQGREGWKQILAMIYNDLGDEITIDHHHVIAEGEFVVDHMTIHGRHQASTMPLLAGTAITDAPAAWTYIHIWRVVDGIVVEHWAVRDDLGLLRQLGAWPPPHTP